MLAYVFIILLVIHIAVFSLYTKMALQKEVNPKEVLHYIAMVVISNILSIVSVYMVGFRIV